MPVALGVRRRVDAHKAAARLDVALERQLLLCVEHISAGVDEHHRRHRLELLIGKHAGVIRCLCCQTACLHQIGHCLDPGRDRLVLPLGGFGEDQHRAQQVAWLSRGGLFRALVGVRARSGQGAQEHQGENSENTRGIYSHGKVHIAVGMLLLACLLGTG